MTIVTRAKAVAKKIVKPKRPVFEEPAPDTLPSETEPQNLEPVYTPPPEKKDKPEMPARFETGGCTAEERERWMKENGYG